MIDPGHTLPAKSEALLMPVRNSLWQNELNI
jgi:hypothetical protein